MNEKPSYRYETIARELNKAIRAGTYPAGTRMPSLRQLSRRYQVSMGTVIQAYDLLLDAGLLATRPGSGYFVRAGAVEAESEPTPSHPPDEPSIMARGQESLELMAAAFNAPAVVQLGMKANPARDLLPGNALARALCRTARNAIDAPADYGDPTGHPALRAQIARHMANAGCHCTPQDIIITNGCHEALFLSLQAVTQPGDTVAIESPSYWGSLHIFERLTLRALEIPTHSRDGVDLDALERLSKQQQIKVCLFMPSCHNPLGTCMPEENKQRLVDLLTRNGIPLIENDATGDLSFETPRPKAVKAFDTDGNVLYCSTFSKTLGAGHRVGWIVPGRHLQAITYLKLVCNIFSATVPQMALAEYLNGTGYLRSLSKATREYQRRLSIMRGWVREYFPQGTRVTNPSGGFLLWVELPSPVSAMELHRQAMTHGIVVPPGTHFSPTGLFTHHIRLSCAEITDVPQAETAIETVGQLAKKLMT